MREAEVRGGVGERQLLPQPVFALAERADPSPNRGDMLAEAEVEAFHKRRIDLPAAGRQHLLDHLQRSALGSSDCSTPTAQYGAMH